MNKILLYGPLLWLRKVIVYLLGTAVVLGLIIYFIANSPLVIQKVADGCLQMYGGLGFMEEMLISRCYRDARLISIGGGADEIMREIIAKMELG